jgi:hypothetical protein
VAPTRVRCGREDGTGMIGTVSGLLAFLLFLLLAVHVLVHLYATSAVTAVAFDAARVVSGHDGGSAGEAHARLEAQRMLGRWGKDVELSFAGSTPDEVVLSVRARSPALLPRAVGAVTGIGEIERKIRVRRERLR